MLTTPPRVPRLTLLWGGAGIIVATVLPLAWEVAVLFGRALLWVPHYAWPQVALAVSEVVLLAAFCVLAFGIRTESGIAGASRVGKTALVVFPAASVIAYSLDFTALGVMATLPASAYDGTGQPDQQVLTTTVRVFEAIGYLGTAGLIVGAVLVIRARVVPGIARWGLAALALATVVFQIAQRTPTSPALLIFNWGVLLVPVIQLVVGVLFLLQARTKQVSGVARNVIGAA